MFRVFQKREEVARTFHEVKRGKMSKFGGQATTPNWKNSADDVCSPPLSPSSLFTSVNRLCEAQEEGLALRNGMGLSHSLCFIAPFVCILLCAVVL